MKNEQKNYLVAGFFVVAMFVVLVAWLSILSGRSGPTEMYRIHFTNVMGLTVGTQVFYSGYPIGYIDRIEPVMEEGVQKFAVLVSIDEEWQLPDDSIATKGSSGLLSALVVNLIPGKSTNYLSPGDVIDNYENTDMMSSMTSVAEEIQITLKKLQPTLDAVSKGAPEIVDNVRLMTGSLNRLLNETNGKRLENIIMNVETSTENISTLSNDFRETSKLLKDLLANANNLIEDNEENVTGSLSNLNYTLESVAQRIDAITANLEGASHNLNDFGRQVRKNPSVILMGREESYDEE
jgi:phospholipid/cholesterol/gamma-HCH transport system substrate-binding protein